MTPDDSALLGRAIRTALATAGDLARHANAIEDIHQDRLDALVLRHGFPEAARLALLQRIGDDATLPWLRPNRTGPQTDLRVLGVAATPTFETPGGPAVDGYFDAAARYGVLYDELLDVGPSVPAHLEAVLGRVAGGRPVERLTQPDGRRFAPCSIRSLPEGQRIIVHNDYYHFQLPVYRDVVADLDATTSLSFLVQLQAPDDGGELVIHGLSHADPTPRLAGGMPDDVLLFAAGRLYPHVAPVIGARPRVTLGGFLTFDRGHTRVVYWN
jgi:hypothetical protein